MGNSLSQTAYQRFDALGRVLASTQKTDGTEFAFGTSGADGYQYNLAGGLTQMSYPRGTVVSYGYYDSGQLREAPGVATGMSYTPGGALKGVSYGNGVNHTLAYNERQQMTSLTASTGAGTLLSLGYGYGAYGTGVNDGNPWTQTDQKAKRGLGQGCGAPPGGRLGLEAVTFLL